MYKNFYYSTNMDDIYRVRDMFLSKGYIDLHEVQKHLKHVISSKYKVLYIDPRDNKINYIGLKHIDAGISMKEEYGVYGMVDVSRRCKVKKLLTI